MLTTCDVEKMEKAPKFVHSSTVQREVITGLHFYNTQTTLITRSSLDLQRTL